MRTLGLVGAVSAAAVFSALGCGKPFSAGAGGGAGVGGDGGAGAGGGAGGASSTSSSAGGGAGAAGGDPSSGGGGQGGCAACRPGEYCAAGDVCTSCSNFGSTLSFGLPSEIPVDGTAPSFPRVRAESGDDETTQRLVYAARFANTGSDLGTASGIPWEAGAAIQNDTINSIRPESGPLLLPIELPSAVGGVPAGSLLFDSVSVASQSNGYRKVFAIASLEATETELVSAVDVGLESYSIAVAYAVSPVRYWFMNKRIRVGVIETALVTKRAADEAAVALDITLPGNCRAKGEDLAPWVTPDGRYLFFQAPYNQFGDCDGQTSIRSFYIGLNTDGRPANAQPARILLPTVVTEIPVMTPSLSPDLCTLYFASNRDGAQKLYQAYRQ